MKLIDKSALVAEIERRFKEHDSKKNNYASSDQFWRAMEDKDILSLINTLEVKEMDLVGQLNGFQNFYAHENGGEFPSAIEIAKHFFELGMHVSNKA